MSASLREDRVPFQRPPPCDARAAEVGGVEGINPGLVEGRAVGWPASMQRFDERVHKYDWVLRRLEVGESVHVLAVGNYRPGRGKGGRPRCPGGSALTRQAPVNEAPCGRQVLKFSAIWHPQDGPRVVRGLLQCPLHSVHDDPVAVVDAIREGNVCLIHVRSVYDPYPCPQCVRPV